MHSLLYNSDKFPVVLERKGSVMTEFTYTIKEEMGLHARPAGVMVKELKALPCNVLISCGNRKADAKKMFALMAMGVKCGETVTVTIEGENDEKAKEYLLKFFNENF
jgi:phosphocarrier protein